MSELVINSLSLKSKGACVLKLSKIPVAFDLGGTSIRLGIPENGKPKILNSVPIRQFNTFPDAAKSLLHSQGLRGNVGRVVVDVNSSVRPNGSFCTDNGQFAGKETTLKMISDATGAPVREIRVVNDTASVTAGYIEARDNHRKPVSVIQRGLRGTPSVMRVNYIGTGHAYGTCILSDGTYLFFPGEGGHIKSPHLSTKGLNLSDTDPDPEILRALNNYLNRQDKLPQILGAAKQVTREAMCRTGAIEDCFTAQNDTVPSIMRNQWDAPDIPHPKTIIDFRNRVARCEQALEAYVFGIAASVADDAMATVGGEVVVGGSHFAPLKDLFVDEKNEHSWFMQCVRVCTPSYKASDLSSARISFVADPDLAIKGAISLIDQLFGKKPTFKVMSPRS